MTKLNALCEGFFWAGWNTLPRSGDKIPVRSHLFPSENDELPSAHFGLFSWGRWKHPEDGLLIPWNDILQALSRRDRAPDQNHSGGDQRVMAHTVVRAPKWLACRTVNGQEKSALQGHTHAQKVIRQTWITSHSRVISKRPLPRMRGCSSSEPSLLLPCWAVKPHSEKVFS